MPSKFYITTPIYYVNASPHIGHSYTTIAADTIARQMRRKLGEENVWLLTGTDEHGQKIQKAADARGIPVQEFTDEMAGSFRGLWKKLNISYNDFIRTTEARHINFVQRALEILYKKGDIYSAQYEGWYCTPCETFWTGLQLQEGNCPDCQRPVEKISETNYFFRLSNYQEWLLGFIKENPNFIRPSYRYNEVLSFLQLNKLTDLCISRPRERLSWGIPLPFSPGHVAYVWFDALLNYTSAVGSFDGNGRYSSRFWPADLHLIGKDILRQHAVYWPIMLRALGIELPACVLAHGWWLSGEDKMSKSRGNAVSPLEIVDKFGLDAYRYFLLRDVPFGLDGNFSEASLIKRINSDLANDLGNLVYRTLTMVEKYYQGNIPAAAAPADTAGKKILEAISGLPAQAGAVFSPQAEFNFSLALERIWELINLANKYIEDSKPWGMAKEKKDAQLQSFIGLLVAIIRLIAAEIAPFLPQTADQINAQFAGESVKKGSPLFPRIEINSRPG